METIVDICERWGAGEVECVAWAVRREYAVTLFPVLGKYGIALYVYRSVTARERCPSSLSRNRTL